MAHSIQTDEIRASKMIGSAVYDVQNRKIGSVDDVILNNDGKVDAVVIDVGSFLGMGGKDLAVLPSDIKTNNNRLTLDRTKEQLQQWRLTTSRIGIRVPALRRHQCRGVIFATVRPPFVNACSARHGPGKFLCPVHGFCRGREPGPGGRVIALGN